MHGLRPTDIQAADYSATTQWLQAVKAVGSTDADKVQKYLDGRQFNDFYAHGGEWRARDHRVTHDMYVVDVLPQVEDQRAARVVQARADDPAGPRVPARVAVDVQEGLVAA